MLLFLYLSRCK